MYNKNNLSIFNTKSKRKLHLGKKKLIYAGYLGYLFLYSVHQDGRRGFTIHMNVFLQGKMLLLTNSKYIISKPAETSQNQFLKLC